MIIVYAYLEGDTKRYTMRFHECPREGEFVALGKKYYKVVNVTHRFQHQPGIPNALENEEYFPDIPAMDIKLTRA